MFNNPFTASGRIGRLEYGLSVVLYFTGTTVLGQISRGNHPDFITLFYIPLLWFLLAQGAKRCHDLDKSGWFQVVPLYFLWMVLEKSTSTQNNYEKRYSPVQRPPETSPISKSVTVDYSRYKAHVPNPNRTSIADVVKSVQQRHQKPQYQQTVLQVANVNYALTQEILKKLRLLDKASSLSYTLSGLSASITIQHNDSSQSLLDDLFRIMPNIDVQDVRPGSVSIKMK